MKDSVKNVIEKYVKVMSDKMDVDISLKFFDNIPHIVFTVDQKRIDKNMPEYDENYANKILPKKPAPNTLHIRVPTGKVKKFIHEMNSLFQINEDIQATIDHKNYEYLEKIESEIKEKIKETSQPNVNFEFQIEWDEPEVTMEFSNFKHDNKLLTNREQFLEFLDELNSLVDVDLNAYRWSVSRS